MVELPCPPPAANGPSTVPHSAKSVLYEAVVLQPNKPKPNMVCRCTEVAELTVPVTETAPPPVFSVSVPAAPLFKTPNTTWVSTPELLIVMAPPVPLLAEVFTVWFDRAWKLTVSAVVVKLPPPVLTSPSNAMTPAYLAAFKFRLNLPVELVETAPFK